MLNTMLNVIEQTPSANSSGFVRPAQIVAALPGGGFSVVMDDGGRNRRVRAQVALPVATALGIGARVLVTGETLDQCYIIGVLNPRTAPDSAGPEVATRGGASARVVEKDGEDRIEVCDSDGRTVFEYCPESGAGILSVPDGDLKLHAPNGNIDLLSGRGIRCQGETVALAGIGRDAAISASLDLGRGVAALQSGEIKVTAGRADVLVRESTYRGELLTVTVKRAKQVFEKLETVAIRILERATDVYRNVENLQQVKAGRMRVLVKAACHIKGGRTSIRADDDVKIGGRRIHLG